MRPRATISLASPTLPDGTYDVDVVTLRWSWWRRLIRRPRIVRESLAVDVAGTTATVR